MGDPVFKRINPDPMYPMAQQSEPNIIVSDLTVDDLMHWLQRVPKYGEVHLVVIHVEVNTCWVTTVPESVWRGLLKLLKTVFLIVMLMSPPFSLPPPPNKKKKCTLRKAVAASNAALVKACQSGQVVIADHTNTFTASSGTPEKLSTTTPYTLAPKAQYDLHVVMETPHSLPPIPLSTTTPYNLAPKAQYDLHVVMETPHSLPPTPLSSYMLNLCPASTEMAEAGRASGSNRSDYRSDYRPDYSK